MSISPCSSEERAIVKSLLPGLDLPVNQDLVALIVIAHMERPVDLLAILRNLLLCPGKGVCHEVVRLH